MKVGDVIVDTKDRSTWILVGITRDRCWFVWLCDDGKLVEDESFDKPEDVGGNLAFA